MNLRLTTAMLNFRNGTNEMLCYPGLHGLAIEVATIAQQFFVAIRAISTIVAIIWKPAFFEMFFEVNLSI